VGLRHRLPSTCGGTATAVGRWYESEPERRSHSCRRFVRCHCARDCHHLRFEGQHDRQRNFNQRRTGTSATATLGVGDFFLVMTLPVDTNTGFAGTVNLSCSGGPPKSTCNIIPSSVRLSGSVVSAQVTVDLNVPKTLPSAHLRSRSLARQEPWFIKTTAKLTVKYGER
jgi:hypothetical protein